MKQIVIFASGSGSNAEKIIAFFNKSTVAKVSCVLSNTTDAKVIEIAKSNKIDTVLFNKTQLDDGFVLAKLHQLAPDIIVLAGFLLKFPESIISEFQNKIINIHPSLLPKYGGHGMYGIHVHKAVFANNESSSGITIHFVDKNYDEGSIVFQKEVSIVDCLTPEQIAVKILHLEHEHFAAQISFLLNDNK